MRAPPPHLQPFVGDPLARRWTLLSRVVGGGRSCIPCPLAPLASDVACASTHFAKNRGNPPGTTWSRVLFCEHRSSQACPPHPRRAEASLPCLAASSRASITCSGGSSVAAVVLEKASVPPPPSWAPCCGTTVRTRHVRHRRLGRSRTSFSARCSRLHQPRLQRAPRPSHGYSLRRRPPHHATTPHRSIAFTKAGCSSRGPPMHRSISLHASLGCFPLCEGPGRLGRDRASPTSLSLRLWSAIHGMHSSACAVGGAFREPCVMCRGCS